LLAIATVPLGGRAAKYRACVMIASRRRTCAEQAQRIINLNN
jgi:hypothetical protein